jgi:hypothetical protein
VISGLLFGAIASFLLSKELHTSRSQLFMSSNDEYDDGEGEDYYAWNDDGDDSGGEGVDMDIDARTDAEAGAYGEYFDMSLKDRIRSSLSYRSSRAPSTVGSHLNAGSRSTSSGSIRGSSSSGSLRPPSRTPSGSILRRISSRIPFSDSAGNIEAGWEEGHQNGTSDPSERATDADSVEGSPSRRGSGHHNHNHNHGHGARGSERRRPAWMNWILNPFGNRPGSEYTEIN